MEVHTSVDESLERLTNSSPGTQINTPETPLTVSPNNWGIEEFSGSEAEQGVKLPKPKKNIKCFKLCNVSEWMIKLVMKIVLVMALLIPGLVTKFVYENSIEILEFPLFYWSVYVALQAVGFFGFRYLMAGVFYGLGRWCRNTMDSKLKERIEIAAYLKNLMAFTLFTYSMVITWLIMYSIECARLSCDTCTAPQICANTFDSPATWLSRILVGLAISFTLFLAEKTLFHAISVGFHATAYKERIAASRFASKALDKLYQSRKVAKKLKMSNKNQFDAANQSEFSVNLTRKSLIADARFLWKDRAIQSEGDFAQSKGKLSVLAPANWNTSHASYASNTSKAQSKPGTPLNELFTPTLNNESPVNPVSRASPVNPVFSTPTVNPVFSTPAVNPGSTELSAHIRQSAPLDVGVRGPSENTTDKLHVNSTLSEPATSSDSRTVQPPKSTLDPLAHFIDQHKRTSNTHDDELDGSSPRNILQTRSETRKKPRSFSQLPLDDTNAERDENDKGFGDDLLIETKENAISMAKKLFKFLVNPETNSITCKDFKTYFDSDQEAERAFQLFDRDGKGSISLDEVQTAILNIYKERKRLLTSLVDVDNALERLHTIMLTFTLFVLVFVWLALFDVNITVIFTTMATLLVAIAFVVGSSAKNALYSLFTLSFTN